MNNNVNICKYLSELTLDSANYLYERLGLVFYINDGELIGVSTEE
ncbi:MAG: hypothetical protein E7E92_08185 [Clostridiales bacterium]|nr:hypothetical protein [Clostridiales bacterium]